MKINQILKKISTPIGGIAAVGTVPLVVYIANETSTEEEYDFGLAVDTVNTLNYIKYNGSVGRIATSLLESFISSGPTGDLKNYLQLSPFNGRLYKLNQDGFTDTQSSFALSNFGFASGVLALGDSTKSFVAIRDSNSGVRDIFFRINKKSKWRSGDKEWDKKNSRLVEGKDFVDSFKSVLDLKNGSQNITSLKEFHLTGVDKIYNAQFEYYKKNKKTYPNPFDGKLKSDGTIGVSDFRFGVTTGKEALEKDKIGLDANATTTGLDVAKTLVPENMRDKKGEWANFVVHYSFDTPIDYFDFLSKLEHPIFLPINKKFIDEHGGIEQFGNSIKNFAWNGAFDIKSLILGDQGSLVLQKSTSYFNQAKVISNKIKFYFQNNEVVKGALFDDGKISYTKVPIIYQMKFWSDPEKRKYMQKKSGFGTIALALNLDKQTNGNSPLQDQNLRKALSYAIDRKRMLKYAGWNSSFPVITWTAFGIPKDTFGRHVETHWTVHKDKNGNWSGTVFKAENNKVFPIQNINWSEHAIKEHSFENANRTDTGFDPETAKYFINKYKTDHPDKKNVVLRYVDDGSPESKKVFIGLQNLLKTQFGNYVILKEKTLPENVFTQYVSTGKFDLIYKNFDFYGTQLDSYIKRFLTPDGINKSNFKTTGFRNNPAGSWTYTQFRNLRKKAGTWDSLKKQLIISDEAWKLLNDLIPTKIPTTSQEIVSAQKKLRLFILGQTNVTDSVIAEVVGSFEKLIRVSTPIIPLMEVDTDWVISRLRGVQSFQQLPLNYVYDVDKKPRPDLPGLEKK